MTHLRGRLWRGLAVLALCLFALLPIWFMLVVALTPGQRLAVSEFSFAALSVQNFADVLSGRVFPFWQWLWNSLFIAVTSSVLLVLFCALSAYAFSRIRFAGRTSALTAMFFLNTVPAILTLVAMFSLLDSVSDYVPALGFESPWPVILIYVSTGLVVNTYLLKGFIDRIPLDVDEAALLDGAPRWAVFWSIILPLTRPMLSVVFVLGFIAFFNDYIIALTFLKRPENQTLAIGLNNLIGAENTAWGLFSAGALLASVPVMIVVLLARRAITTGLTAGATKG